ncbi:MAG: cytidine deaminase [Candidatus Binatia bacterium]
MPSSRQNRAPGPNADLLDMARVAATRAYCPYSKFPVGAAVLTADDRVFSGANVENASYGLTICAERTAIFNAVCAGAEQIVKLAVSCPKGSADSPPTLMPCGACRQVLAEFATPDTQVIIDHLGTFSLATLLPRPFGLAPER